LVIAPADEVNVPVELTMRALNESTEVLLDSGLDFPKGKK